MKHYSYVMSLTESISSSFWKNLSLRTLLWTPYSVAKPRLVGTLVGSVLVGSIGQVAVDWRLSTYLLRFTGGRSDRTYFTWDVLTPNCLDNICWLQKQRQTMGRNNTVTIDYVYGAITVNGSRSCLPRVVQWTTSWGETNNFTVYD